MGQVVPKNAAVHKIVKQHRLKGAQLVHSTELKCDTELERLLTGILATYNQRLAHRTGVFDRDDMARPFADYLDAFLRDDDYFKFTRVAASHLRNIMDGIVFASGGYILFVHYTTGGRDFLLCVKLTEVDGQIFDLDNGAVTSTPHLATENLQQAARINLDGYASRNGQYLNLVSKRNDRDASEYFEQFIGFTSQHNPAAQTASLVRAIRDFCKKQNFSEEQANVVQTLAHDHLFSLAKQDQSVSLATLSAVVSPDDPPVFMEYINSLDQPPTDGFPPKTKELKPLIKIHIKLHGLTLSMTRDFKEAHGVHVDDDGSLVIANVPDFVREQLE